jgi:hypothetical protein
MHKLTQSNIRIENYSTLLRKIKLLYSQYDFNSLLHLQYHNDKLDSLSLDSLWVILHGIYSLSFDADILTLLSSFTKSSYQYQRAFLATTTLELRDKVTSLHY